MLTFKNVKCVNDKYHVMKQFIWT